MENSLKDFKKNKKFLVCIDSDGSAMDTMEIKHKKCFGPKAIEEWGLQSIENKFMEVWNNVNLYSKTRGINRFKGLVKTFELLSDEGFYIPDFSSICKWTKDSNELSNPALEKAIKLTGDKQLIKALSWSKKVNKDINKLSENNKPFPNVKEGIKIISTVADIVIVSSANSSALNSEWSHHGLLPYVKVMLGQEAGTKAKCIASLKKIGYLEDEILMIGDAPSDLDAALKNEVLFYPILVGKESFSWQRLISEALTKFINNNYKGEYQESLIKEFNSILK
ncbi:Phosphoglycolate phosphatase, HAD superfamily [Clostridium sp. USBA 49]|uniref:HAD hydrolase-like protein n=1 Tax=Clostridium sp. USBA 49 TaxID=1881060 RepID=UPI00099B2445|nr:HAD hydrolase-like protein [Clostridium sp. USBA 49]SKA82577.1 Phosphoglycolate phosphatase, HAD superfamily [Clostridium sp. USBA 49]